MANGKATQYFIRDQRGREPKRQNGRNDMGDELREIRLGRDRNTKEILRDIGAIYARDMGAIDAKYKLKINKEKNEVCSSFWI